MSIWDNTKFTPKEFGASDMNPILIKALQHLRSYVGVPIHIHSGYRKGNTGYHPLKMAADIHIEGMHVVDQYLTAERFPAFTGIGVYPNWNNPGLHVDVRPLPIREFGARWVSPKSKVYVALNKDFLIKHCF